MVCLSVQLPCIHQRIAYLGLSIGCQWQAHHPRVILCTCMISKTVPGPLKPASYVDPDLIAHSLRCQCLPVCRNIWTRKSHWQSVTLQRYHIQSTSQYGYSLQEPIAIGPSVKILRGTQFHSQKYNYSMKSCDYIGNIKSANWPPYGKAEITEISCSQLNVHLDRHTSPMRIYILDLPGVPM
jgi:hypothetical protein